MWMLVGLGNPGSEHRNNRHNIGFMAADAIARRHSFPDWKNKFQSEMATGMITGEKALLLRPQTYMNLSGQAVQAAMAFYKIKPENIVVLYDELDLAPGKVRVKMAGGSGGHNGIKSIDSHIGQNYWRVRMGIGHPGDKNRVSGYVLNDFAKADEAWLEKLLDVVADEAGRLVKPDMEGFMTAVARKAPAPNTEKENGI
ncbi:MAG: aminoacyl-tRNA hydrolase [Alphaproteobacteria bacterium]|nr:aminoacyl-tRNA hydrolase [Alphaproteobacteria bacterium]